LPASIDALWAVLRCPICHSALSAGPPVSCTDVQCSRHGGFPSSRGQPVLIDFDRSIFTSDDFSADRGSVLSRETGSSLIGRALRRMTYGSGRNSSAIFERFSERLLASVDSPRLLVIGGGTIGVGMAEFYRLHPQAIVGIDAYASEQTAVICDAHELPFQDQTFDGVVIQAVLEHVLDPGQVVDEIHRVLKPEGLLFADTPFMQQVHEAAYDFTRFTVSGHRWLFRRFQEIESGVVAGPGIALLWSISYYVRALGAGPRLTALIGFLFSWVRLLEKFMDPRKSADAASAIYFIGRKSPRTLAANQIPSLYEADGRAGRVTIK
jgi:SAM-dependent methyltransferase